MRDRRDGSIRGSVGERSKCGNLREGTVMVASVAGRGFPRASLRGLGASCKRIGASVLVLAALAISSRPALSDFTQQGPKLSGTGAVGAAQQGTAMALSADGNTAIVGGASDDGGKGAAWVYIRSTGVWTQQSKLVAS